MKRYDFICEVDNSIDFIEHIQKFNPYHGKDGRFTSKNGCGTAISSKCQVPKKYKSFVSSLDKKKVDKDYFCKDKDSETISAYNMLNTKSIYPKFDMDAEIERCDKKIQQLEQKFNGKKNKTTNHYPKEQYEEDIEKLETEKWKIKEKYEPEIEALAIYRDTFLKITQSEELEMSRSPYGESYYAYPKGTKIDWGQKPEGSYRYSDHWNFNSEGQTHCPTVDGKNYGRAICKVVNGKYELVMQLVNDVNKSAV